MNDKTIKNILVIFLMALVFYLMSVLKSILIPLVLAFLLASFFYPFIKFFKDKKLPAWLVLPVVVVVTLLVLFGISQVVIETSEEIAVQQDFIYGKLNDRVSSVVSWANEIGAKHFNSRINLDKVNEYINFENLSSFAGGLASSLGSFTTSFAMFALYYIVLLSGMMNYDRYLQHVGGNDYAEKLIDNFQKIQKSIVKYLGIKTLISIITGFLVFVVCSIFGVKFPFFWAFLTFLLNYIPTIGSTISVIPPVLMGIVQFDSPDTILFLLILLVLIQMLMGNFIEPIIMGSGLKLNTLTVIFGLVFWGYIWGIPGMMLSVPLLVLLKLILELSADFSFVARLMESAPAPPKKIPKLKKEKS